VALKVIDRLKSELHEVGGIPNMDAETKKIMESFLRDLQNLSRPSNMCSRVFAI
jgi:hypothetical protein